MQRDAMDTFVRAFYLRDTNRSLSRQVRWKYHQSLWILSDRHEVFFVADTAHRRCIVEHMVKGGMSSRFRGWSTALAGALFHEKRHGWWKVTLVNRGELAAFMPPE